MVGIRVADMVVLVLNTGVVGVPKIEAMPGFNSMEIGIMEKDGALIGLGTRSVEGRPKIRNAPSLWFSRSVTKRDDRGNLVIGHHGTDFNVYSNVDFVVWTTVSRGVAKISIFDTERKTKLKSVSVGVNEDWTQVLDTIGKGLIELYRRSLAAEPTIGAFGWS